MFQDLLQGFAEPPFEEAPAPLAFAPAVVADAAPLALAPAVAVAPPAAGLGRGRRAGHVVDEACRTKMKLAWARRKLSLTNHSANSANSALHPSRADEAVSSAFGATPVTNTRCSVIDGEKVTDHYAGHHNQFAASQQRGVGHRFLYIFILWEPLYCGDTHTHTHTPYYLEASTEFP